MKKVLILTLLLAGVQSAWSQATYHFQEGLAVGSITQYGREAIYSDQLAHQLYNGTLAKPADGGVLVQNVKGATWKKVSADTSHRFRGDAFSAGYIYLTYESKKEQVAVLTMTGHDMVYVNAVPRGGDMYRYGWMHLPVMLKKGKNEFYARVGRFGRYGGFTANLTFPEKPVTLLTEDLTMPDVVGSLKNDSLWVGVVVQNASAKKLSGAKITSELNGRQRVSIVPDIPPMSIRKVPVLVDGSGAAESGATASTKLDLHLSIQVASKEADKKTLAMEAIREGGHYRRTFLSDIDGSVQYYAVAPQVGGTKGEQPALFLSVHGAEVQAINQARAYKPKDWGVLVAPTNRRPRGFNWEDWGRMDALEVLSIAKKQYNPDPSRIYLTGHSMGGHGTWFLGATYPEKWAAIAPSAGYPTLASYGSHDGMIPDSARTPMEAMLLRASNPSNVLALTSNYKTLGVYVAHGDADRTVPVTFARQMRDTLSKFHRDFSYYEHIGGEHWYGDISVDWPPIFNFFSWHSIPKDTSVNAIDFKTASPGVSSKMRWAGILQQIHPLQYSRVKLALDKKKGQITGTTSNVATLSIDLGSFAAGQQISISMDGLAEVSYTVKGNETIYLRKGESWKLAEAPEAKEKNPARYGTLKDAFRNKMVFVYATNEGKGLNNWAFEKARFDAESWYFRGNGAVDLIADKDFEPKQYQDRGVILYGNSETNLAWNKLLADCPVKVSNGKLIFGEQTLNGDNLTALFLWPRADSPTASVAVISGTGRPGFLAANANQYLAAGSGFSDFLIYSSDMLKEGLKGLKMTGFFNNNWKIDRAEIATE